ncbi:SRPBCC domain-containing protein [Variovorax sp. J31P179]|uniref:SRPBCC family protein n=1 Tax=Variovorax sp. J31P179 TaxID=3053508 RepID=UPI002575B3DF|nr:SRPBCC domain-containing protein [Variovorax sp. J31P179]MDM0079307.1 SRPBCC domain-containing protein [Variovorax sp. J31P179]
MHLTQRSAADASSESELSMTRTFKAPRSLVFKAWTEPAHLARWSGPQGFTTPHHEMDLRVGGTYRACLRAPDGVDHWVKGVYREIRAPERLVMTHCWTDAAGNPTGPETLITVTLTDRDGATLMNFHQALFESSASRDGHSQGWSQSFDRLVDYLAEGVAP